MNDLHQLSNLDSISRRRWLIKTVAVAGISAGSVALGKPLMTGDKLIVTPSQTEGPFYPSRPKVEQDADLVRITGSDARALGTILHLKGQVVDRQGNPVPHARVEIWQCDKNGIYHHPADRERGRDLNFQGFGFSTCDSKGHYAFRTIKPAAYPGRSPHIHFKVKVNQRVRLNTQMYDADNVSVNAADSIYRSLSAAEQEAVTVRFHKAPSKEPNALLGDFRIVLA